jgi:hypothetical protein
MMLLLCAWKQRTNLKVKKPSESDIEGEDTNESAVVRQLIEKYAKSSKVIEDGGSISSLMKKVVKERSFLEMAHDALKREKTLLKRKQLSVERLREQWKHSQEFGSKSNNRVSGVSQVTFCVHLKN